MRVLAADIGGTSIRAALVDEEGTIFERASAATPADPGEGYAVLDGFWSRLDPSAPRAVVIAGGLNGRTGELTQSPNLPGWEGTFPGKELGATALNDANGALLGEAWIGALKGRDSAALLTLGTGVGGALLLHGELWVGREGCAGEIGHVSVRPDGPPCLCGNRGCLELYAGARGIAKAAGTQSAQEAAELARSGELRSRSAWYKAGEALGISIAGLANLLNPEAVCLGGGVAASFDLLIGPLRREIESRTFRLAREDLEVVPAALGSDSGLLGAARAALNEATWV